MATNFIVGRSTASAIASASRKSFFCPFEYGRTYWAGISGALWSSALSCRRGMLASRVSTWLRDGFGAERSDAYRHDRMALAEILS